MGVDLSIDQASSGGKSLVRESKRKGQNLGLPELTVAEIVDREIEYGTIRGLDNLIDSFVLLRSIERISTFGDECVC